MDSKREKANYFILNYSFLHVFSLSAPYKTNCFDYNRLKISKTTCYTNCLNNLTINNLKRVPYSSVISQEFNLGHVTFNDLQNDTFEALLTSYEERCNSKCSKTNCDYKWYFTEVSIAPGTNFGIRANSPIKPSFTVRFKAQI